MEGGDLRMSGVDQRVVEMKFDKGTFSQGVQSVLDELAKLKDSLKLDGASQGLSQAADGVQRLGESTGGIAGRFTALQAVALGALASIGAKAVEIGSQLVKSLTIDPITGGLQEYETNLNSIQTILANTQASGATLENVNAALQQLNTYSDQTIYNFSEMARNIGTFTAAGVGLDQSVSAIKGIANLAALSGSNSEQASTAMYQLSQAIAAGRVGLQDWNSVVNAGMGGTVFQRALAQTAVQMGVLSDGAVKLVGPMKNVSINGMSFRDSMNAAAGGTAWITSDVLTNTLQQFTGDLTDAQLAAQGFSEEQIAAIQQTAKTAKLAATEVKTLSGVLDVAKETVGSGWAQTWQIVFGDFGEAKATFTDLSNTVNGMINTSSQARNAMLQDWKDLGGRTVLIDGIKAAFQDLMSIIKPIKDAFRQIFPATTGQQLYEMTVNFRDLMQSLRPSTETIDRLQRTFAGFFAILHIGWTILKGVIGFIFGLFSGLSEGGSGILGVTASFGDFLVKIDAFLSRGDYVKRFFDWLHDALFRIIDPIMNAGSHLGDMFGGLDTNAGLAQRALDGLHKILDHIREIGDQAGNAWDKFTQVLDAVWQKVQPIVDKIKDALGNFADDVANAFDKIDFSDILGAAGIGGLVGLVLTLRKGFNQIKDIFSQKAKGPGLLDSVKESLEKLTDTLKSMQNTLKAATILEIAAAIGILTIAVSVLSKIDAAGLTRAVTAIGVMVIQLTGAMVVMDKAMKNAKGLKLDMIALGMILLAAAIDILASAVKKMSDLSWADLAKGISATIVLLGALVATMQLMPDDNKKMITSSAGILILAEAIKVLVSSVKTIADMDWAGIAKGLTGVATLLTALALYSKFSNTSSIGNGLGLLLLAAAIKVLASAMKDISDLSWADIAKGITGVAGSLTVMVAAMKLLPKKSIINGAAIIEVSAAMKIIASALKDVSDLDWGQVAKGVVALGGSLAAVAIALKVIPASSIVSAGSLIVAALAIKVLADALQDFGKMSWADIAKSLVELAGALTIIGVALTLMDAALPGALALLAATPAFSALAKAMVLMGGMTWSDIAAALVALAGALLILTVGLTAMIAALPGALALIAAGPGLMMLADVMQQIGAMSWADIGAAVVGLAAMFVVLAIGGALSPLIAALAIALGLLAGAIALAGAGIYAAGTGFDNFADAMTKLSQIDRAGIDNITDALQALIDLLPSLATSAATAVSNFITEISNRTPEMAAAAGQAAIAMAQEVANDMPQVVSAFMDGITNTLNSMADRAPEMATAGGDLVVNTLNGISDNMSRIITAGANVVIAFFNGIGGNSSRVATAGFNMVIDVMNGIADAIRQHSKEMRDAAANIGDAILDGISGGVNNSKKRGGIMDSITSMATNALSSVKSILGIKSPSTAFAEVGKFTVLGFVQGLDDYASRASDSANALGGDVLAAMGKTISGLGSLIGDNMDDLNPVVTPVLDLTNIQRDSGTIGDLLQAAPISFAGTYAQASVASAGQTENQALLAELTGATSRESVSFTQNNYSPKALSAAEIYRQTNNQLSQAKGALNNAN
jgi:tape measure domain-containing protein